MTAANQLNPNTVTTNGSESCNTMVLKRRTRGKRKEGRSAAGSSPVLPFYFPQTDSFMTNAKGFPLCLRDDDRRFWRVHSDIHGWTTCVCDDFGNMTKVFL